MSDPSAITDAIRQAEDAFEYRGQGRPSFEAGIDQDGDWPTQITKACRYLDACRALRDLNGFNGAVVELCFGAIERSLEGYVLWTTDDDLTTYQDHTTIYHRVAEVGLFTPETANSLADLYDLNRTDHYYGALVPTQQKENAMYHLAEAVHTFVTDQIRDSAICQCDR